MASISADVVRQHVSQRLATLRQLPYTELQALPEFRTEDVPFGNGVASVTTYRDSRADGVLTIVVQFMPQGDATGIIWRGVLAEGFLVHPDGTFEVLPDSDRFYYM